MAVSKIKIFWRFFSYPGQRVDNLLIKNIKIAGSFFVCWFYHCNEGWNVWHLAHTYKLFFKIFAWKMKNLRSNKLKSEVYYAFIYTFYVPPNYCMRAFGHHKVLQKHKICQDNITKITCHIGNFWIWHFKTLKEKSDIFFLVSVQSTLFFLSSLNFCEFIYW